MMSASISAGAVAPPIPVGPLSAPRIRQTSGRLPARLVAVIRNVGSTIGAGLDGLLIGLVVAYVAAVFVSGPSKFLGLPWPVQSVLAAIGALAFALLGAGSGRLARGLLLAVGRGLDWLLARVARRFRWGDRVRGVLAIPFRILSGVPAAWLGAFAALLVLANLADAGPLGLFIPAGALGAYIVLGGVITGLLFAAGRIARPGRERAAPVATWSRLGPARRIVTALLAGVAIVVAGGGASILVSPGSTDSLVTAEAVLDGFVAGRAPAPEDPGARGPYPVRATSYGSGTDLHRIAFGSAAAVTTPTVDASRVLDPLGWGADESRAWFWGFGTDALPLNGLVWLPEGDGPFPLVLIVHGNHAMGDFSEPGYAYLGEHLASRGMVTVSVDENFLNGSWASDWGGREQLVRAWFLLLHLDQWRTWTADPMSPYHGLVDLDRVGLIGHSRGGEAASVAASLAGRGEAPDPDMRPWPTGLRVRAVVGIAPSDGQYSSGQVVLTETDYLTLHGGHDSDATSWMGSRQYARTVVDDGAFKAALWSYRSNHGQFSTTWGRSDHGPLGGALLNLAPILDPAAQRDVAMTAIGAFLEGSLHGRLEYRDLFRRPMVGREWLPVEDIYLVRSGDEDFVPLTTGDPARGRDGTTVSAVGFESVRAFAMPLRALLPDQGTQAVELRWGATGGHAVWAVENLEASAAARPPIAIRFALANGATEEGDGEPLLLEIELATTDGVRVTLPIAQWGALPPALPVRLAKDDLVASLSSMDLARGAPVERVLQTYELPLSDFAGAAPSFDPARLSAVRLVVNRSTAGVLWVTEVGLVPRG
jgi:dienelactone hydrolase